MLLEFFLCLYKKKKLYCIGVIYNLIAYLCFFVACNFKVLVLKNAFMRFYFLIILLVSIFETSYTQDCVSDVRVTCMQDSFNVTIDRAIECSYSYAIEYPDIEIVIGEIFIQTVVNDIDSLPSGTNSIRLPVGEHLFRHIVVDTCGRRTSCIQRVIVEYQEVDYQCAKDFIILYDNSGSISFDAFPGMTANLKREINQVGLKYPNSLFSSMHYGGFCGDSLYIDHDFLPYNETPVAPRKLKDGDDLNEALGQLKLVLDGIDSPLINSPLKTVNPREDAELNLIICTNAEPKFTGDDGCSNTAMLPYDNINILKAPPYNIIVTVMHFGTRLAYDESAAIASPGGKWDEAVDTIPGQVENQLRPRRFIPATSVGFNINLLHTIPSCLECTDCNDVSVSILETDSCSYKLNFVNNILNSFDYIHIYTEEKTEFLNAQVDANQGFSFPDTPLSDGNNIYISYDPFIPYSVWNDIVSFTLDSSSMDQQIMVDFIRLPSPVLPATNCSNQFNLKCQQNTEETNCLFSRDIRINCKTSDDRIHELDFRFVNNSLDTLEQIILTIDHSIDLLFTPSLKKDTTIILEEAIPPDAISKVIDLELLSGDVVIDSIKVSIDIKISSNREVCQSKDFICEYLPACCDICEGSFIDFGEYDEQCCRPLNLVDDCLYTDFQSVVVNLNDSNSTLRSIKPNPLISKIIGFNAKRIELLSIDPFFPQGITLNIAEICLETPNNSEIRLDYELTNSFSTTLNSQVVCNGDTLINDCNATTTPCVELIDLQLDCDFVNQGFFLSLNLMDKGNNLLSPDSIFLDFFGNQFLNNSAADNLISTGNGILKADISLVPIGGFPSGQEIIEYNAKVKYQDGTICITDTLSLTLPSCADECCSSENEDLIKILFETALITEEACQLCVNFPSIGPCDAIEILIPTENTPLILTEEIKDNCYTFLEEGQYEICFTALRYSAEIQDFICLEQDTCININPICKPAQNTCEVSNIFANNIISRNGDGINDVLKIDGAKDCPLPSIIIYNRWGQEIYSNDSYENDWNGIDKSGNMLADGTYLFTLSYKDLNIEISNYVEVRSN